MASTRSTVYDYGEVAVFCESGNASSCSINFGEFLDYLKNLSRRSLHHVVIWLPSETVREFQRHYRDRGY
jgi:hypothetical protein